MKEQIAQLKAEAKILMTQGNISAYIQKLTEVGELKTKLAHTG